MIKLYDEDSYITEFSAVVEQCKKTEKGYMILLDRTAFFPEAGGQDCDTGTLGGQSVLRVHIAEDMVYHLVKNPINVGETVKGVIERGERLRKMRHHSAEHIVSGIVNRRCGLDNVGFHLGEKDVTMDYDGVISQEMLDEIEREANMMVLENRKIICEYPSPEELQGMEYRSKLDLAENVRIVTIDGVDVCACCAPHVRSTGEIGVIKLRDVMNHRGGVRMRMICGEQAYEDYEARYKSSVCISNMLSVKQEEIVCGVKRVMEDAAQLKAVIAQKNKEIAELVSENQKNKQGAKCYFMEYDDSDLMRMIATALSKKEDNVVAVLYGDDEKGYRYVIFGENIGEDSGRINNALSGRGGGRGDMIQGSFAAKRAEIEEFMKKL